MLTNAIGYIAYNFLISIITVQFIQPSRPVFSFLYFDQPGLTETNIQLCSAASPKEVLSFVSCFSLWIYRKPLISLSCFSVNKTAFSLVFLHLTLSVPLLCIPFIFYRYTGWKMCYYQVAPRCECKRVQPFLILHIPPQAFAPNN